MSVDQPVPATTPDTADRHEADGLGGQSPASTGTPNPTAVSSATEKLKVIRLPLEDPRLVWVKCFEELYSICDATGIEYAQGLNYDDKGRWSEVLFLSGVVVGWKDVNRLAEAVDRYAKYDCALDGGRVVLELARAVQERVYRGGWGVSSDLGWDKQYREGRLRPDCVRVAAWADRVDSRRDAELARLVRDWFCGANYPLTTGPDLDPLVEAVAGAGWPGLSANMVDRAVRHADPDIVRKCRELFAQRGGEMTEAEVAEVWAGFRSLDDSWAP